METLQRKRRNYKRKKTRKSKLTRHCERISCKDAVKTACIYKEGHQETGCHCHFLEVDEPESDHHWDTFEKEEEMRAHDKKIEKQMESTYGEYIDAQPCFPPSYTVSKIQLPNYLDNIDKIDIKAKMTELEMSRESAKEIARHYRDRCSELQIKVKKLESKNLTIQAQGLREKQQVRHFWRNQILEGQSRSGRILKMALS